MAIVSPAWTNMVVFYVEGDYGHLLNETVHRQQFRTMVRGAPISCQLPREDLLQYLQRNVTDKDLLDLPRSQESLQYFVRVHLNVQGVDMKKHLKHLHLKLLNNPSQK